MSDFSKRYKNYSNLEILEVIEHANNYQKEAVNAAKEEWSKRGILDNEKSFLLNSLKDENSKNNTDFYSIIDEFLLVFKPLKNQNNSEIIYLNRVVYILSTLFIYYILRARLYFDFLFSGYQDITFFDVISILQILLLPLFAYFIYVRKSYAWTVLSLFCVLKVVFNLLYNITFFIETGFEGFDIRYYYDDVLTLIAYPFILWNLYQPSVKKIFISQ